MLTSIDTNVKISDDQKEMSLILNKFEHKEPSIQQLAEHLGFNADEQKMIKLFWEPAFNNNWIYLSPTLIKDIMGYKQASHFYKDTLYTSYIKNIDYKEIKKDDVLVKLFDEYQQNFDEDKSSAKDKRGGSNAKYYSITGKTLKKCL